MHSKPYPSDQNIPARYEAFGCRVNAADPSVVFGRYAEAGFLYPEKADSLIPFLPSVVDNWRRACDAGLLRVITYDHPEQDTWASISMWNHTHSGLCAQHLVGLGGPLGSRAVILAAEAVAYHEGTASSCQMWFRPTNPFPRKVFGSIVPVLGPETASVQKGVVLAVHPKQVRAISDRSVTVIECRPCDAADLYSLATQTRGPVYAQSELLADPDVRMEALDERYRAVGLRRYRRCWLAWLPGGSAPAAAAIAYRGPLGLNFSFLENRCDVLVDPTISPDFIPSVLDAVLEAAGDAYSDFELDWVPCVVDDQVADVVGARHFRYRVYHQGIWLASGCADFYWHVHAFYDRMMQRGKRRGFATRPANLHQSLRGLAVGGL